MKKIILLLTLGLACGSLFGCNESKPEEKKQEIIDESILVENLSEIVEHPRRSTSRSARITSSNFKLPEGCKIHKKSQFIGCESYGVYLVHNSAGYLGFYNAFYGKFIIAPCFTEFDLFGSATQSIVEFREASHASALLISVKDKTLIIDTLGNVYYEGPRLLHSKVAIEDLDSYLNLGGNFVKLTINDEIIYLGYEPETSKLLPADEIFKRIETGYPQVGDSIFEPEITDMTPLGCPGHTIEMIGDGLIKVSKDGKEVTRYKLDLDLPFVESITLVGHHILAQSTYILDERAEDYTFIADEKYMLRSDYIDLLTGEMETVELDYLVGGGIPLKHNDVYTYALAHCYEIKNRTLREAHKIFVLNEELEVVLDATGKISGDLIKVKDVYFDYETSMVYDENLKPKFAIKTDYVRALPNLGVFYGRMNNFSFLLDTDGNYIEKTKGEINILDSATHYIVLDRQDNYVKVSAIDGSEEFDFVNVQDIREYSYPDFVTFKKDGVEVGVDYFGNVEQVSMPSESLNLVSSQLETFALVAEDADNLTEKDSIVRLDSINVELHTWGTEKTTKLQDGQTYFTAKPLVLGEQTYKAPSKDGYYFASFTPEETGYYNFNDLYGPIDEVYKYDGETYTAIAPFKKGTSLLLKAGVNYVFAFELMDSEITTTVEYDSLVAELNANGEEIPEPETANTKFSRLYTPTENALYSLKASIEFEIIDIETGEIIHPVTIKDKTGCPLEAGKTYIIQATYSAAFKFEPVTKLEVPEAGFEIDNTHSTPWIIDEEAGTFTSASIGDNGVTLFKLYCYKPGQVKFDLDLESEQNWDKLYIIVNGNQYKVLSGFIKQTIEIDVPVAAEIRIFYQKDSSGSRGKDRAIISNFSYTFA